MEAVSPIEGQEWFEEVLRRADAWQARRGSRKSSWRQGRQEEESEEGMGYEEIVRTEVEDSGEERPEVKKPADPREKEILPRLADRGA